MEENEVKTQEIENNSGKGEGTVVPDAVAKKFNWGAFFFGWIWGIFNKAYITLIIIPIAIATVFVPKEIGQIVMFATYVTIGILGNKWAWQNKEWESVEKFHKVQKAWAIAGTIFVILMIILGIIAALTLPAVFQSNK